MPCCSPSGSSAAAHAAPQPALTGMLARHADSLLTFVGAARPVNPNYHITEVRVNTVSALDCGRLRESWQEIVLQVLDSPGSEDAPMTAGKLASILREALADIAIDPDAKLVVELSDGTEPIHLYTVAMAHPVAGALQVRLSARAATCKAVSRWTAANAGNGKRCC